MKIIPIVCLLFFGLQMATSRSMIFGRNPQREAKASTKMTFMRLNEDCQLLIFEQLNVVDLLSFAQTESKLFASIKIALKRKIAKNEVTISVPNDMSKLKSASDYVKDYPNRIEFRHWPTIHWLFEHYGHIITNLRIKNDYELSEDEARTMYETINAHCSDTLIQLHISNNNNEVFSAFKKPFTKVEIVSLFGGFVDSSNFSEVFPSLRRLNIGVLSGDKLNLEAQVMPSLEVILLMDNPKDRNTDLMRKLIKNHPHIKSLILHEVRPEFLEYIASELPHLEKLHITLYEENRRNNYSLNFQHLKSFSMTCAHFPLNIILEDVDELKIRTHKPESMLAVDKVIQYRKNLKKIELIVELNDNEMLKLANGNLNVIEMLLTCEMEIDAKSIIKLIESSGELKRLKLVFGSKKINEATFDALNERFSDEWKISKNDYCINLDRF